jgi:ABC-type transport system involved in multi-copper enzyme maturation permease subunit
VTYLGLPVLLLVVVGLALVCRRTGFHLFGPVLFYDMVRVARRGRYFGLRLLYAGMLVAALGLTYFEVDLTAAGSVLQRDARLAQQYFVFSMMVQMFAVGLLTPAYVGAAIGEDKERGTLEFMLATDLSNHEIVLGKFVARLANLILFVLIGLPILSFMQFLGGIDPELVLAGFVATLATAVGTGAFGILCSVLQRRAVGGVLAAFVGWIGYNLIGLLLYVLAASGWAVLTYRPDWPGAPSLGDVIAVANTGNLIIALLRVQSSIAGSQLYSVLWQVAWEYSLFHGLIAAVCLTLAIWRLRPAALRQAHGTPQTTRGRHVKRPRLGDMPIVWREAYLEHGRASRVFTVVLYVACITGGLVLIWTAPNGSAPQYRQSVTIWACGLAAAMAFLLILSIGVKASRSISTEREKSTWDALIATPLDSDTILREKLLACLLSRWPVFLLLVLIWIFGVIAGDMHSLEPLVLAAALLLVTTTFAVIGLWLSLRSQSSSWAMVGIIALDLGLTCFSCNLLGPAHIFAYVPMLSHMLRHQQGRGVDEAFLVFLAFTAGNVLVYALAAAIIWFRMLKPRFRRITLGNVRRPRPAPVEETKK